VGARGWIVLSKDPHITKREIEKLAVIRAGVSAFFLRRGELKGNEVASIFANALARIVRLVESSAGPVRAIVHRDSSLNVLDENLRVPPRPPPQKRGTR